MTLTVLLCGLRECGEDGAEPPGPLILCCSQQRREQHFPFIIAFKGRSFSSVREEKRRLGRDNSHVEKSENDWVGCGDRQTVRCVYDVAVVRARRKLHAAVMRATDRRGRGEIGEGGSGCQIGSPSGAEVAIQAGQSSSPPKIDWDGQLQAWLGQNHVTPATHGLLTWLPEVDNIARRNRALLWIIDHGTAVEKMMVVVCWSHLLKIGERLISFVRPSKKRTSSNKPASRFHLACAFNN